MFRTFLILSLLGLCVGCDTIDPEMTLKLIHGKVDCTRVDNPNEGPISHVCSEIFGEGDGATRVCYQRFGSNERTSALSLTCDQYESIKAHVLGIRR